MTNDYRVNITEPVHNVIMEGREKLTVSGVEDVDSFDENEIISKTVRGRLVIRGEAMKLEKLSLDTGEITALGKIDSIEYENDDSQETGGFLSRLFR